MAEKNKTFYWIKLRKEFMDGETIDFLMSQKNGANYVVLYQMLIMKTLNTEGQLCNKIGECIIPFNAEKIQRDCKWFDIDTVRIAMELYSKLGLIYKNENNLFTIANFEDMVGSETYWAKIKRLEREKKDVGQIPTNVQNPLISNISISNNLISNNINNKNNIRNNKEKEIIDWESMFETLWKLYPRKENKQLAKRTFEHKIRGLEQKECIDKCNAIYKAQTISMNEWKNKYTDIQYIPHYSSWLNNNIPNSPKYKGR